MKRHAGFTLIELLVVVGILSMLLTIMLPSFNAIRRFAQRVNCRGNLSAIGKSITSYATEHMAYPATAGDETRAGQGVWIGTASENIAANTDQAKYWLFNDAGQYRLSPSASFFLLVRDGSLPPEAFVCVADREARKYKIRTGTSLDLITDFGAMNNISYSVSYLWNYFDDTNNTNNVDWPKASASGFPLMSDLSPVGSEGDPTADDRRGNSWNHVQEGQNVLFADAHVDWTKTNRVGLNGDNIFTRRDPNSVPLSVLGGGSGANPVDTSDTVMCFYGER